MMILDTNVVSELSKPSPNARVLTWLNQQPAEALFLTAISVAELQEGLLRLPEGRRKEALREDIEEAIRGFVHPVLPFDSAAAHRFAELVMRAKARKYTLPIADGYVAAIADVHGFAVATRDVAPFQAAGVAVINPWEE